MLECPWVALGRGGGAIQHWKFLMEEWKELNDMQGTAGTPVSK